MPVEIKQDLKCGGDHLTFTLLNNPSSSLEIYTFGATVTSWKSGSKERLFLSSKAHLDGSKAIRGGIPLVFPQFGTGPQSPSVQHGFARISHWKFLGLDKDSAQELVARFSLDESNPGILPTFKACFPYAFRLIYTLKLTSSTLCTGFHLRNNSETPFEFTALLHSYFGISDISKVKITGLESREYVCKVLGVNGKEPRKLVTIEGEVDRIYKGAAHSSLHLTDEQTNNLVISSQGFEDVVVWNPGPEKAAKMSDLDGFRQFVCLELGSVVSPIRLDPGQEWSATQTISAI